MAALGNLKADKPSDHPDGHSFNVPYVPVGADGIPPDTAISKTKAMKEIKSTSENPPKWGGKKTITETACREVIEAESLHLLHMATHEDRCAYDSPPVYD